MLGCHGSVTATRKPLKPKQIAAPRTETRRLDIASLWLTLRAAARSAIIHLPFARRGWGSTLLLSTASRVSCPIGSSHPRARLLRSEVGQLLRSGSLRGTLQPISHHPACGVRADRERVA